MSQWKFGTKAWFTYISKQQSDFSISWGFYFSKNFADAKFLENKTLIKISELTVSHWLAVKIKASLHIWTDLPVSLLLRCSKLWCRWKLRPKLRPLTLLNKSPWAFIRGFWEKYWNLMHWSICWLYSKTCVKRRLKNRQNKDLNNNW